MDTLVNRVAQSGLITLKLEDYFPDKTVYEFDLKDYLFHGLILKELDFRKALKEHDWNLYKDSYLTILCSADAIIPTWAYMLVASYASEVVADIYFGTKKDFLISYYRDKIRAIDASIYKDSKIVIKGCSDKEVPASAYLELTAHLKPFVASIMFGEPCSTVPVYKRGKG
ncbi:MAG: DUF2480 family protein [Saprospiraceae bacterium]|nr:DUF2480 family protein [Saprospiraceae bacterium]